MIAELLLAGICANPPNMSGNGVKCGSLALQEECRCEELIRWDPIAPGRACWDSNPSTQRIEIERKEGSVTLMVGRLLPHYVGGNEDTGEPPHPVLGTHWYFAWDVPFPEEGHAYLYKVRSCSPSCLTECSPWENATWTNMTGAPYRCYAGNPAREILCGFSGGGP